jgi:CheY-like chemotaxis protein
MKILIVEDDKFYARRLHESLSDFGLDAHIVNTAQDALLADITHFDVAIIDIMLPNDPDASGIPQEEARGGHLSGVAVARRLKRINKSFPLVLFSGYFGSVEGEAWAKENDILYFSKEEGPRALRHCLRQLGIIKDVQPRSFIVHGHDEKALLELKDYVQNSLHWQKPIVLRDEPSSGKTIIEKFEEYASAADYVFVLMTPDDEVKPTEKHDLRRSRQNVIFELGFFYSQFGRKSGKVIVLHKGPIELPSDIQGIIWIDISNGVKIAGEDIRRELKL